MKLPCIVVVYPRTSNAGDMQWERSLPSSLLGGLPEVPGWPLSEAGSWSIWIQVGLMISNDDDGGNTETSTAATQAWGGGRGATHVLSQHSNKNSQYVITSSCWRVENQALSLDTVRVKGLVPGTVDLGEWPVFCKDDALSNLISCPWGPPYPTVLSLSSVSPSPRDEKLTQAPGDTHMAEGGAKPRRPTNLEPWGPAPVNGRDWGEREGGFWLERASLTLGWPG